MRQRVSFSRARGVLQHDNRNCSSQMEVVVHGRPEGAAIYQRLARKYKELQLVRWVLRLRNAAD